MNQVILPKKAMNRAEEVVAICAMQRENIREKVRCREVAL